MNKYFTFNYFSNYFNVNVIDEYKIKSKQQMNWDWSNILDDEFLHSIQMKNPVNLLDLTYDKIKKIIAEKNITCKEDYYKLCDKDIRLPREPDVKFGKQFKNWIDFLDITPLHI